MRKSDSTLTGSSVSLFAKVCCPLIHAKYLSGFLEQSGAKCILDPCIIQHKYQTCEWTDLTPSSRKIFSISSRSHTVRL